MSACMQVFRRDAQVLFIFVFIFILFHISHSFYFNFIFILFIFVTPIQFRAWVRPSINTKLTEDLLNVKHG